MIPEIDNADWIDLRLWWHDPPARFTGEYDDGLVLDEIAFGLLRNDQNWISFLSSFAYSEDVKRRKSAIMVLASRGNATSNTEQMLRDAFQSTEFSLQAIALQGFIHLNMFPLTKADIALLSDAPDQRLPAWGMAYLCYAFPAERRELLKSALRSENPRMREFACDVIGDEHIEELRQDMACLRDDTVSFVSESARYNYREMFD